jgi:hypothetical protein
MVYKRNDEAGWMDDLEPANDETPDFAPSPMLARDEPPEGLEVADAPDGLTVDRAGTPRRRNRWPLGFPLPGPRGAHPPSDSH